MNGPGGIDRDAFDQRETGCGHAGAAHGHHLPDDGRGADVCSEGTTGSGFSGTPSRGVTTMLSGAAECSRGVYVRLRDGRQRGPPTHATKCRCPGLFIR